MADYLPKTGLPDAEPEHLENRNRGKLSKQAPGPARPNHRQKSADNDAHNQRHPQKPQNGRNRHHNLASQIRSLEKLLKHPNARMSANVRQEKGRELAALSLERERKKAKNRATKNLGKYHMVRFVERQKCDRILKGLTKRLVQIQGSRGAARKMEPKAKRLTRAKRGSEDSDTDLDADGGVMLPDSRELDLEGKIRQAEVDLNYTIYAPLGEKYISLFPRKREEKIAGMSGLSKSFLESEEEAEVRRLQADNVVRTATGERPPMWFRVQASMQNGTLEQLRDGGLSVEPVSLPQVGPRSRTRQGTRSTPSWVRVEGKSAVEDPDSDEGSDDNDEQKIDGGFFEKA